MVEDVVVDMWDEPHHHRLFQNELVQVVDARLDPGEAMLFHRHVAVGISVLLTDSAGESQRPGEPWRPQQSRGGDIGRVGFSRPRIHRVRNVGSTQLRIVDVEVRGTNDAHTGAPLVGPALHLAVDEPEVRAYRISLAPEESANVSVGGPCVFIMVSEGTIRIDDPPHPTRRLSGPPGTVLWEPTLNRITNDGEERLTAAMVEVR